MDLVLITDNNYVVSTYVTIFSAATHFSGKDILKVHVCGVGLNDESVALLNRLEGICKIIIHTIKMEDFNDRLKHINQQTHVTTTALIKFELPNILKNISKVLYIDGDIIIKKNIATLFETDISNYLLAATHDFWKTIDEYNHKGKSSFAEFYFNSGVMLINLDAFREKDIPNKLWDEKIKQSSLKKSSLMDQNVLNAVCKDNVLKLPIKYNCNVAFSDFPNVDLINSVFSTKYNSTADLIEDAVILHYVGKHDKPWKYTNAKCRDVWISYFSQSELDKRYLSDELFVKDKRYYKHRILFFIKKYGFFGTIKYLINKKRNKKNDFKSN